MAVAPLIGWPLRNHWNVIAVGLVAAAVSVNDWPSVIETPVGCCVNVTGVSSSVMETVALAAAVTGPVGLARTTRNVSVLSTAASLIRVIDTVLSAPSPAAHEIVPLAATKSSPEIALPDSVAYWMLMASVVGP